jgi:hypothetical protein
MPPYYAHVRTNFKTNSDRSTATSCGVTLAFDGADAPVDADFASMLDSMVSFWNDAATGTPLAGYLSATLNRGANVSELAVYDITGALGVGDPAGSPVAVRMFTLGNPVGGVVSLPAGDCGVLSWRAAYGSDVEFGTGTRPRASDRNRMYIGPINSGAINDDSEIPVVTILHANFRSDLLRAILALQTALLAIDNPWQIEVWSRKDAACKDATVAWVDDRPDYQRRRSAPMPATRTYEDLPQP